MFALGHIICWAGPEQSFIFLVLHKFYFVFAYFFCNQNQDHENETFILYMSNYVLVIVLKLCQKYQKKFQILSFWNEITYRNLDDRNKTKPYSMIFI
jgi:hypothetical protein